MRHFFLPLLILWSTTAVATVDLVTVYQQTVQTNPALLAEAAAARMTEELAAQAHARYLPEVALTASTGRIWQENSVGMLGSDLDFNNHGYALRIIQPLYQRQNSAIKAQAASQIVQARTRLVKAQKTMILTVAIDYFAVLAKQADLEFSKAEYDANALQFTQVAALMAVGAATITDNNEAQAAKDLAAARVVVAEEVLANSRLQLAVTAGMIEGELAPLKIDSPLLLPVPADSAAWQQTCLENNPTLVITGSAVTIAKHQVSRAQSEHYPSLNLVGEHLYNSVSDGRVGANDTRQSSISLQLKVPIYAGGAVNSRIAEARHRLTQAMQQHAQQQRNIILLSQTSYNAVVSGVSQIKALAQAVASSKGALAATKAGFDVGTRTAVDVTNSRREVFRARRDHEQARYLYIVNTLRLKQAAGQIVEQDLKDINQWLERE